MQLILILCLYVAEFDITNKIIANMSSVLDTVYERQWLYYFTCTVPVNQDVQHSLGGGEGAIGGEEDGDEGGVAHG